MPGARLFTHNSASLPQWHPDLVDFTLLTDKERQELSFHCKAVAKRLMFCFVTQPLLGAGELCDDFWGGVLAAHTKRVRQAETLLEVGEDVD